MASKPHKRHRLTGVKDPNCVWCIRKYGHIEVKVVTCQHHWKIDEPQGNTSIGYCIKCNQTKEFQNYEVPSFYTTFKEKQAVGLEPYRSTNKWAW